MSYQDLQINLTGKDVSASDALRSLARAASQAARSAGDSLEGMNRRVEESSQRASSSVMSGFGGRLSSWAQSGLAGILGGVAASVSSSVMSVVSDAGSAIMGQLKSSVIDYNSQLENATIGFTTMLGSSGKAQAFLDQLQAFAKRTPFQFGDLTNYAQQMMGYGISAKNVIPYLTALGDASAGAGKSSADLGNVVLAFEQMSARGKVDLGDMNQLTSGGVPALKILANAYHTTTGGMLAMISSGKVMSADALPKLITGIEHGTKSTAALGGMMTKQSGTFAGAMSNIQDAMDQTLSLAFRPFYKTLEGIALKISDFAGSKAVQKWAKEASAVVGQALNIIGNGFNQVFGDPKMQKSMSKLGGALSSAFKGISPALQQMMPDLVKFGQDVFPAIVDGITAVVKHFPAFMKGVQSAVHELATWGPAIAGFIGAGAAVIGWLVDTVSAFQRWHDHATGAIISFGLAAEGNLKKFIGFMQGIPKAMLDIGGHIVSGFVNGLTGAWGAVTSTVNHLVDLIPAGVRKILGIQSPSTVFREIGGYVGKGLQQGLLGSVSQIQSASNTLANTVIGMFKGKDIGKATESAALRTIDSATNRLQSLSRRRSTVEASLKAEQQKITDQRSARDSTIAGVKSSTVGAGDVSTAASSGDMIQNLQSMLTNTRRFKSDLTRLAHAGIDQTTFGELVNGWQQDPSAALRAADQLIANPMDLKQVIALQKQLGSAAGSLATYAGGAEYNPGIRSAKSRAATLSGEDKALGWEMQKVAATMVKSVARQTHITINLSGHYAGTKDDLAKSVTTAIRDAVRRGQIPKNVLTAL